MAKEAGTGSTEINPNVEVGAEPVADKNAGEAVTFDDVADVMDTTPAKAVAEPPQKSQKDQEAKRAKKAEGAPETKGEPILPGSEERAGASAESDPGEPQPAKKIKAWDGDKEVEYGESVEFVQKVAGKPERVNLRTLLDNYSGTVNWDRKNNELSSREKQFEEQYNLVNTRIQEAFKASQDGDPDRFIHTFAKMAGQDPVEVKKTIMQPIIDWAMGLADKSPEERERLFEKMELDTYKKMHEDSKLHKETSEARNQWVQKSNQAKEMYGIADADYNEALQAVAGDREIMSIDPGEVVQYHMQAVSYQALKEVMPEEVSEYDEIRSEANRTGDAFALDKANKLEMRLKGIWSGIVDMAMRNRLQYADLVDITRKAYGDETDKARPGTKEAQALARKANQTGTAPKPGSRKDTPEPLVSFDQL